MNRPEAETERLGSITRITVAVDASPDSLAAMEAAAELAARMEAHLEGVFVEETDLLRVGELPHARELSVFSKEPRDLEARDVERQLRILARRLEQRLRQTAEHTQVPWSFRTARGTVPQELRRLATESDLLVVGVSGRSVTRGPGSTVRDLLTGCPSPLMVLRRTGRLGVGVHVLYDGTQEGREAVETAARFAGREGHGLTVFLVADDDGSAERMAAAIGPGLSDRGIPLRLRRLPRMTGSRLAAVLRAERCGLLVTPRSERLVEGETLAELLRTADFPVLVVG